MAKQRVLLDTCVIFEAHRVKCWNILCNHFEIETVRRCVEECCSGNSLIQGYIPINSAQLEKDLSKIHEVDEEMLMQLQLDNPDIPALDDGELHMMAWLNSNPGDSILMVLSTADRAAIRAAYKINLIDKVVSLQELCQENRQSKNQINLLQDHFKYDWLATFRTQIKQGHL